METQQLKKMLCPMEDRISALPNCLLIHILSLLPSTRDAIRTGILSKRWLYLWTNLPVLIFIDDAPTLLSLANYINKTLFLHACPKLHKFELSIYCEYNLNCIAPCLFSWLRFATLRQAQDLTLRFEFSGILPQFFYINLWLHKLEIEYCDLASTGKVEWTSLKVLEIGYLSLSDETLHSILLGSPVLESLKLYHCYGIHEVDIGSSCSRLRTLVVDDLKPSFLLDEGYAAFLLSGSSIQHLEIDGDGCQKWTLGNMPSLLSIKLHFRICPPDETDFYGEDDEEEVDEYHEMCREVVRGLFEKVGHVEQLELGAWCIQVLSTLEVKGIPAPFIDCKLLSFKLRLTDQRSVPGMASVLCGSSKLEKLAIDVLKYSDQFNDPDICEYVFEDNYWRSNERICNHSFTHLRSVEIFGLKHDLYKERFLLFKLIEFLLKNGRMLEKMVVHLASYRYSYWKTEDVVKMEEELLSFPRSSPCAIVTVVNVVCPLLSGDLLSDSV